jgi:hypothetical protein
MIGFVQREAAMHDIRNGSGAAVLVVAAERRLRPES